MILLPILLAGITVTGPGSTLPASSREITLPTTRGVTLLSAATAAAQRQSFTIGRTLGQRPPMPRGPRRSHYSLATRVTAIFAGAVLGSFGGATAGGAIDKMTSNGECLTFTTFGMPIGAAIGGVLAARAVQ